MPKMHKFHQKIVQIPKHLKIHPRLPPIERWGLLMTKMRE